MKFLVDGRIVEDEGRDISEVTEHEMDRVAELRKEGVIELVLRRQDSSGGYFVLEADDLHAAEAAMATLPLVRAELLTVTITPVELM